MRGQPTSAIALNEAEKSGSLNGKRFEVARAFETYGPGTSAEVLTRAGLGGNLNLMRARVTELADLGWITPNEPRKCKITGRQAIVWSFERCSPRAEPATKATKSELVSGIRGAVEIAEFFADLVDNPDRLVAPGAIAAQLGDLARIRADLLPPPKVVS